MKKNETKVFAVGTLLGTIAGAITALLFAPKPGKELRQDIAEGVHTAADRTQSFASKVGKQTTDFAARAKDAVVSVVEDVKGWRASGKGENSAEAEAAATSEDVKEQ